MGASGLLARATLDGFCYIISPEGFENGSPTTGVASSCGGVPPGVDKICKVGFIDHNGEFAIPANYESALDFQEEKAGVRINGLWGFVDKNGNEVIAPEFEEVKSFSEGRAAVKLDGKWGFIDDKGKYLVEPHYDFAEPFSDSLAVVVEDGEIAYIDPSGTVALTGPFLQATSFVHGLAAVALSETRVAYINKLGGIVFEYFRAQPHWAH